MSLQLSMNFKKHIWSCPSEYKDLSQAKEIAIDLETRDGVLELIEEPVGPRATEILLALRSLWRDGKVIIPLLILVGAI